MTPVFRTILNWLEAHGLSEDAEVWVLGSESVEPVLQVHPLSGGSVGVASRSVWSEPVPVPLHYGAFYAKLLECYSGAGTLKWMHHRDTYRGSYVVNPHTAVFLLFLPDQIELVQTHEEKTEQRREQAKQLTEIIEKPWDILT